VCTALHVLPGCVPQEDYIKEEQKNLKRELLRAQEEVKRIQSVPLVIGQFLEMVNATSGIVGSTTGAQHCISLLGRVTCPPLQKWFNLVGSSLK
jgi:ATP-dependent 26S proteasome regulatory subunit